MSVLVVSDLVRVSFGGWALHPGAERTNSARESEKLKESVEGGAGAGPAPRPHVLRHVASDHRVAKAMAATSLPPSNSCPITSPVTYCNKKYSEKRILGKRNLVKLTSRGHHTSPLHFFGSV